MEWALAILREELEIAMALLGAPTTAAITWRTDEPDTLPSRNRVAMDEIVDMWHG